MKKIILLLFVTGCAILFGGSLYSSLVTETLWSSNPPESLKEYGHIMNLAGAKFFSIFTPTVGLLSLITLATSYKTAKPHLWWRLASSVSFLTVFVWTILYFVPTVIFLSSPELDTIPSQEVIQMTKDWVSNDDIRMVLVIISLLCGIRALFLPVKADGGEKA